MYGSIKLEDITNFELASNVLLPADYKAFIIKYNGGRPSPNSLPNPSTDVAWLYGMFDEYNWANFFYALDVFKGRIPSWYIPVGCDSGGNIFIMS